MNIIVIVSDTLRRDYLPTYGNERIIAPHLSEFARNATVFDQAYAGSFPTVPARADLMTGRYTFTYLKWGPLPLHERTLADMLNGAGYLTCGIADNPFLIRNGYGYDRGFKDFQWIRGQLEGPMRDDVFMQRRSEEDYFAPKTFKTAAEWLQRHYDEKFFLYIDTWDPHEPWDPPHYYVTPYYPAYKGEVIKPPYWNWKEHGLQEKDLEIARATYSGEITMVDRWFGYLVDTLNALNILDETAIIFLSDHGFYFGEHELFGKRRFRWPGGYDFQEGFLRGLDESERLTFRSPLHQELTRIPLFISMPSIAPTRISAPVSIPDIMPTVLDMAGVAMPESVQAKSLLPLIKGEVKSLHDIVVTSPPFETIGIKTKTVDDLPRTVVEVSPASITDGEWDLIYARHGDPVELYCTVEDPGHTKNVFDENQAVAQRIHQTFIAWLKDVGTAENILAPRLEL